MKAFLLAVLLAAPARAQVQVGASANAGAVSQGVGASGASVSNPAAGNALGSAVVGNSGGALLAPSLQGIKTVTPSVRGGPARVSAVSVVGTVDALALPSPAAASSNAAEAGVKTAAIRENPAGPLSRAKTKAAGIATTLKTLAHSAKTPGPRTGTGSIGTPDQQGRSLFDGEPIRQGGVPVWTESGRETPDIARLGRPAAEHPEELNGPAEPKTPEIEPSKMPFWKRAGVLGAILGGLAVFPPLLSAELLAKVGSSVIPGLDIQGGLGMFMTGNAMLANPLTWIAAAAITLLGYKLRVAAYRMFPAEIKRGANEQNKLIRRSPWRVVPLLVFGAAMEEYLFRGLLFGLGFLFLSPILAAPWAFMAASLASSLIFAISHGYGSLWTRVVGGMIYSAVFALSGSLLYAAALHFLHNLRIYFVERRKLLKQA